MAIRYSHSRLEEFHTCPRKYRFKRIERVSVPTRVAADLYLGDVVHRALEILYKHGSDGVLYPLDDIIAFSREQWDKPERALIVVRGDHYGVDDYIRLGVKMLTDYYEQYQPFDQGKLLGTESNLNFTLPGTTFDFMGKIDRLFRRDDDVVEICDYKTGRHLASPGDRRFRQQMGLYELAVRATYPQIESIEVAQYYLRSGEIIRHRITPDERERLVEELRLAVVATIRAERLDDFPTKEGGHCSWCDYEDICPAKAHRRLIDEGTNESLATDPVKLKELAEKFLQANQHQKEAKAAADKLRAEIIAASRESGLIKLEGDSGVVTISIKNKESLPTKSKDGAAYTALQIAVRDLGLDEFLKVDDSSLLKEGILKRRLSPEHLEKLAKFVTVSESVVVRTKSAKVEMDSEE
jgi:putative RecB family exonuclease